MAVIAAIEACYRIATSIDPIIDNYTNAHKFIADLRRTCEQMREHLRCVRTALDQGPLATPRDGRRSSILASYYASHDDFDERLVSTLRELEKFRFEQDTGAEVSSRMQMIWKRPRIEDMKRDILLKNSAMLLLLVTILMWVGL